jgi:thioredoxin:protein disulfide reductase
MKRHFTLAPSGSVLLALAALVLLGATAIFLPQPATALDPSTAESVGEAADPLAPPQVVTVRATGPIEAVKPGGRARIRLELAVEPPWHINAHEPLEDFLIPTDVALAEGSPLSLAAAHFPSPEVVTLAISEQPMAVYTGAFELGVEVVIPESVAAGPIEIAGVVTSQACNDQMCMPPAGVPFTVLVTVHPEGAALVAPAGASTLTWGETSAAPTGSAPAAAGHPKAATKAAKSAAAGGFDASRGLLLTYALVFLGGLALNLTPCVYPMIPITISIFGAQGGGPRQALKLAMFYVLGMAITYSALGTVAALTGSMLGSALQNPLVLVFIAAVMIGLALSMFGLYDIQIPQGLSKLASGNRQGAIGSLLMGLTVGIIAAPCIGPFVLGLLTYVGSTGNPLLGFSMFFVLALGLGVPFLFLATASGSLANLPRSGGWMIWVKKIFGFILLGMALYFLSRSERILPERFLPPLLAALAVAAALVLAVIDRTTTRGSGFKRVKQATGFVCLALVPVFLLVPRFIGHKVTIDWQEYNEATLQAALTAGRPVIIDFSATWCIPCKELEHVTFASQPVVDRAQGFVTLKADLTDDRSPVVRDLKQRFQVLGVPTVVFLGPDGTEIPELRFTGVIRPDEFLKKMTRALDRAPADA